MGSLMRYRVQHSKRNSIFMCTHVLDKVKKSLTNSTTRSDRSQSLSVVLVYLRMCGIPLALGRSAYLSAWQEEGALCVECLAVFCALPSPPSAFHCVSV